MRSVSVENTPNAPGEPLEQASQAPDLDLERVLARAQELREITSAYPIDDDAFTKVKATGRA